MLTKYARSESPLEIKMASERIVPSFPGEAFSKFAALEDSKTEDGFLYVRTRAISSRVNKNNDGWPSEELAKAYKTFVGRPVFVDHNNSDPKRTRGVIVDSKLHVEDDEKTSALDPYYSTAPDNHKPPTWVEILIEVDAKTYPKLAKAIKNGDVDATSMGANIDRSICSVCANEATSPSEYCDHIKKKGVTFEITADNGEKIQKKSYEDCYGVNFFEDSFVFDPADETALNIGVDTRMTPLAKVASWYSCQECNTLLEEGTKECPKCGGKPLEHPHPENMPEQPGKRGSFDGLIRLADGYHVSCRDCGEHMINVRDDQGDGFYHCKGCGRTESNLSTLAPFLEHRTAEFGMGGQGVDKERVINYEPQSDMIKAPSKVDTLQDDIECPNCRSDYLQADPDGILRCPTCSYEQPPTGLDNPDLGAAQRENDKDLSGQQGGQGQGQGPSVRAGEEDMDLGPNADSAGARNDDFIRPIKPLQAATKNDVTTEEISEMIWKRKIQTDSAAEADAFLPHTAGSVEVPIEYPGGIHFGTHQAFQKHGLNATVHYPGAPQPLPIPGNAMQHFMMQINAQKAQGLENPGQLVVRVDAPDDQLDNAVKLIHSGGNENDEKTSATIKQQPKKEVLVPQPDKPQPTVESDQFAPVTSSEEEEGLGDKEADRRVIKREESPDGHRTEQIIEETGELGDELKETPKDEKEEDSEEGSDAKTEEESSESESSSDDKTPDFLKKKEPVAASVVEANKYIHKQGDEWVIVQKGTGKVLSHHDSEEEAEAAFRAMEMHKHEGSVEEMQARMFEALAVAEEYVDAGLMPKGSKLAFVGQLENLPEGEVAAYRAALALFKSANVTPRRVSHTSRALPRLGSMTGTVPANNGTTSLDEIPFEAVFLS